MKQDKHKTEYDLACENAAGLPNEIKQDLL